jgi:twitching motility protein PilT
MKLRSVLETMVAAGASDLHLKAGVPPAMRVDGVMRPVDHPAPTADELRAGCESLLSEEQRRIFAVSHEIDFAIPVAGLGRFRANVFVQRGTLAMALRHVPTVVPAIESLNLPPVVRELAFSPRGLILVTGRSGTGKSTTLAAMIDAINQSTAKNIISVEDPIEFLHHDRMSFVQQREVGADTRSFHDGLKYVLRQDPDVILIGEIRDVETMTTALNAADTGHLVMSTLHTTDVAQSIQRILSFYPPHQHEEVRLALSTSLRAVISQRLLTRADGPGRVPAVEVLVATPTVREYLLEPSKTPLIRQLVAEGHSQYGMQTFDQSLLGLVRQGLVTPEEAIQNASHPSDFALKLKGIGGSAERG